MRALTHLHSDRCFEQSSTVECHCRVTLLNCDTVELNVHLQTETRYLVLVVSTVTVIVIIGMSCHVTELYSSNSGICHVTLNFLFNFRQALHSRHRLAYYPFFWSHGRVDMTCDLAREDDGSNPLNFFSVYVGMALA